jgi:type I restriction enzyme S subunit
MNKIEELIEQLCPDGVSTSHIWELTLWDKKFNAVDNFKQLEVKNYKYFL